MLIMKKYLITIKRDFNDFTNNSVAFQAKIANLNKMFGLNTNNGLMHILPTYYAGNLTSPKYVIIGINPGFNANNIKFENQYRSQSWNAYKSFHDNFFMYYRYNHQKIAYYSYMAGVIAPNNIYSRKNNWNYFQYCHDHIFNIDIIPYHSYSFKQKHTNNAQGYIRGRFCKDIIPLLTRNSTNVKRVIIHDKRLFNLLQNTGFIHNQNRVYSEQTNNGSREIYSVNHQGIEFRIFSRFIPNGGFSRKIVQQYL